MRRDQAHGRLAVTRQNDLLARFRKRESFLDRGNQLFEIGGSPGGIIGNANFDFRLCNDRLRIKYMLLPYPVGGVAKIQPVSPWLQHSGSTSNDNRKVPEGRFRPV